MSNLNIVCLDLEGVLVPEIWIAFAEASGISISLFRALFSKQFGMSPVQYRNRLRIDRAAVILSEGSCTVSEAAYACGFENIGYFCRCYKKFMEETPMETKLRSN